LKAGTVFWVTGLAGAGKSSIGKALYERLRARHPNAVLLDGDRLREVFGNDLGHAREARLASAMRNARLCKLLSEQGIHVVCATISMFRECRAWNRAHLSAYLEIYVRTPMAVLERRDPHSLYSRARRGEIRDVVGIDIPAEEPEHPDLVLDNDDSRSIEELADSAWRRFGPTLAA
jgi:adenylyl-sulfate kinase